MPSSPLTAWVEDGRVYVPVGKAHGVHSGSEFVSTSATIGNAFTVDQIEAFRSSGRLKPHILQLLKEDNYQVLPFRWSLGNQSLRIAFNTNTEDRLQQGVINSLKKRISSKIEVAVISQSTKRHADSLAIENRPDGRFRIRKPSQLEGYEGLAQNVGISSNTPDATAEELANQLSYISRFLQILDLRDQASSSPKPFDVYVGTATGTVPGRIHPYNQQFIFAFHNKCNEDLFMTILNFGPGFSVHQGSPEIGLSERVRPNERIQFPFMLNRIEELQMSTLVNERQVHRNVVRIVVVKSGQVSWRSLEQPNIWSLSHEARSSSSGGIRSDDASSVCVTNCDWWVVDEEILTVTNGLARPTNEPQRNAQYNLCGFLDEAKQHFRLGCHQYLSFSRTGNFDDIDGAIRWIQSAIQKASHEAERGLMRAALGEMGFNLSRPSFANAPTEYLRKAIEATKATGLTGSYQGKLLNQLGILLNDLFGRTRDVTVFEEAVQVTKEAVSATVGDHAEHASALVNFCNRLSERHDQNGSVSDLDEAIECAQEAMQETFQIDEFEALQTSIAGNLGNVLRKRFSISRQTDDLEDSLNFCAIALDGSSPGDPHRPLWQSNMGMALGSRYSLSRDINDLEDSIHMIEEALRTIHPTHVARKGIILNLAIRLRDKFLSNGSRQDLDRAINGFREVQIPDGLHMAPNQQVESSRRLTLLGVSLGARFELTKQTADIEESVKVLKQAFAVLPPDNLDREVRMSNASTALRRRYLRHEVINDLNEAISLRKDFLRENLDGGSDSLQQLEGLGLELSLRFGKFQSRDDIDEAIQLTRRSISSSTLKVQPETADQLVRLAAFLHTRFETFGEMGDLNEATSVGYEALQAAKELSKSPLNALHTVCCCLMESFSHTGQTKATDDCIRLAKDALQEPNIDVSHRRAFLGHLGTCFNHRFSITGDMSDLNELIRFNRQAVKLLSDDDPSNYSQLCNMAGALRTRFDRTGQMVDLDEGIQVMQDMLKKAKSENRILGMVNLAGLLAMRFDRIRNIDDINQAISLSEQTISVDHSNRFLRLSNCGGNFLERFNHTGQISDLNSSIELLREATLAVKETHTNFLDLVTNLAHALEQRHRQSHEIKDLDEAVDLGRKAARQTAHDHPQKARRMFLFGLDIWHRYKHSKAPQDLHEAKLAFFDGLNNEKGDVATRISAGKEFLKLCDINEDGQGAYSVAETIVNLIPLVASLSQRPADKQYFLSQVAGSASDATAIALHAGKSPASAIELLETGRGVIAGTLQDLRLDVSILGQTDAELADRFTKLRNTLDTPGDSDIRHIGLSAQDDSMSLAGEGFEADKRHEASMELSSILDEIRRVPGFERFLLAGTENQMRKAANQGPILIINTSSYRCDALVVEQTGVQAFKLPDLKYGDILSHSSTPDSTTTLEWLWDVVVGPVLNLLGFTSTPIEGQSWPHVWWIPTGPLARFPLHAAGYHLRNTSETALDRVISSYSLSVKAIINASSQYPAREEGSGCGSDAILVSMSETPGQGGLQYAKKEIDEVERLCSSMGLPCTQPKTTQDDVLAALNRCKVFHFAGHGGTRPNPLDSLLLLSDYRTRPLTVRSLLDRNIQSQRPFLAYLSACGTGQLMQTDSVDESIHLISAFQLAGFRHVVGTLWSVDDEVCLDVAKATYEAIREYGYQDSSVSLGLHRGLRSLRDRWVASQKDAVGSKRDIVLCAEDRKLLWAPYVHFGV